MSEPIYRKPKFANQLFLFEKIGNDLKPVKKIELTENQKKELIEKTHIIMKIKTHILMLVPGKDELVKNANQLYLYKPVIDIIKKQIIILGIYKVDENQQTIH